MKKIISLLLALSFLLSGCSFSSSDPTTTAPSRMVVQIRVSLHPEDPSFDRVYTSQENLDVLLKLLRDMQTEEKPETTPDLNGGQSYYAVTITYANGRVGEYHLLGHSWLQMNGDWCRVSAESALEFNRFLKDHPSD